MSTKNPTGATARTTRTRATRATTKATPKAAPKAAPAATPKAAPTRAPRTFDATGVTEYVCAGACGETKPVSRFITKNHTPLRYVECRACRDARVAAAKAAR